MEFLSFNGENYIMADAIVAITTPKTPPPPTVLVHLLAGEACWSIPFDFDTREEAVDAARKIMATLNKENKITETNLGQGSEREVGLSEGLGAWVPAQERVPAVGTECVVLVRYSLDRPPFVTVDRWDVQREDPTGMGGPTIETGEGWSDNFDCDVIAWIEIPPHPPAEWDQRLPA